MKIAYVDHPCSPELKAKYRKDGFKVVDSRFNPNPEPAKKAKKKAVKKPIDGE